tara:strand:- start:619 stop:903 length:285 start_codon:yes stop_codon:yes gene_type:complete
MNRAKLALTSFFSVLFSLIISLNSVKVIAQTPDNFEIKLKQIEYIDVNTKEHTYINANSSNSILNLSRNYNHILSLLMTIPVFNTLIGLQVNHP